MTVAEAHVLRQIRARHGDQARACLEQGKMTSSSIVSDREGACPARRPADPAIGPTPSVWARFGARYTRLFPNP
ncbi:hypothetical protein C7S17_1342 [Burkholderia thailandensis]|nr:hypothetical protein [Burkholderia thailandensis]